MVQSVIIGRSFFQQILRSFDYDSRGRGQIYDRFKHIWELGEGNRRNFSVSDWKTEFSI